MDAEQKFVDVGGLELATWVAGRGDKLAVCLHGFPDDPGSFAPLMEGLVARGYTAAAPYLRGYGKSDPAPDGDYSLPSLAHDPIELIKGLGFSEALLIGHDWGAILAYLAAAKAPTRVTAVVGLSLPPPKVFLENLRRSPRQLGRSWYMGLFQVPFLAKRALKHNNYALIDRLWKSWSPKWTPQPERLAEIKRTFDYPGTVDAALAYYRALFGRVPLSRLSRLPEGWALAQRPLQVPTLVLTGAADGAIGAEMFRGTEEAIAAKARFSVLPGAGHWLPLERPDRILEWTDSFLETGVEKSDTPKPRRRLPTV